MCVCVGENPPCSTEGFFSFSMLRGPGLRSKAMGERINQGVCCPDPVRTVCWAQACWLQAPTPQSPLPELCRGVSRPSTLQAVCLWSVVLCRRLWLWSSPWRGPGGSALTDGFLGQGGKGEGCAGSCRFPVRETELPGTGLAPLPCVGGWEPAQRPG